MTALPGLTRPLVAHLARVQIAADGAPAELSSEVVSLEITRRTGRIPRAVVVLEEGDLAERDWPLSESDGLAPGADITLSLGHDAAPAPVFRGKVLRHRLEIPRGGRPRLVIEAADAAVAMTAARRSCGWRDMSVADVIRDIAGRYPGLSVEAGAPGAEAVREQVVQDHVSDWDFVAMLAESAGAVLRLRDGVLTLAAPPAPGPEALTLEVGGNVLSAELELDSAAQAAGAGARVWEPEEQEVAERDAEEPSLALPADPDGAAQAEALGRAADVDSSDGSLGVAEAEAALGGRLARMRAAALRGLVETDGLAEAEAGGLVRLEGFGARFSGVAAVDGIRHLLRAGRWITEFRFGADPRAHEERFPDSRPRAGAGGGLRIGTVTALEGDPQGGARILVRLAGIAAGADEVWARLALPHAGDDRGLMFRPELGDEVVLAFIDGAAAAPVVLGALHSGAAPPPVSGQDANDVKVLRTRSGLEIRFDDAEGVLRLETPEGNSLALTDADSGVRIEDQSGNEIRMRSSGIELTTSGDLKLSGGSVTIEATGQLRADGAAGIELTSSAVAVLRGALVQIN